MNRPTNPANVNSKTHGPGEHTCRTHHSPTPTTNGQNADCRPDENAWPFPVLHNLILAEVFHARPEALTVTELFQRTHGRFTASGLLEFARAVVWLEEEGLLEPVAPQEFA